MVRKQSPARSAMAKGGKRAATPSAQEAFVEAILNATANGIVTIDDAGVVRDPMETAERIPNPAIGEVVATVNDFVDLVEE